MRTCSLQSQLHAVQDSHPNAEQEMVHLMTDRQVAASCFHVGPEAHGGAHRTHGGWGGSGGAVCQAPCGEPVQRVDDHMGRHKASPRQEAGKVGCRSRARGVHCGGVGQQIQKSCYQALGCVLWILLQSNNVTNSLEQC